MNGRSPLAKLFLVNLTDHPRDRDTCLSKPRLTQCDCGCTQKVHRGVAWVSMADGSGRQPFLLSPSCMTFNAALQAWGRRCVAERPVRW